MNNVSTSVEYITPAFASMILEKNKNNRPLPKTHVKFLKHAIERGEWVFNGEPIIIDSDGNLLDGQCRLTAVAQSGVSIQSLVVKGIPREVFDTIDQGKSRSAADILAISGEKNTALLGGILRSIYLINYLSSDKTGNPLVTPKEIESVLEKYPNARQWCDRFVGNKKLKAFCTSKQLAVFAVAESMHGNKAVEFFDKFSSGANLRENDPAFLLREKLIEARGGGYVLTQEAHLTITIKAWNAYITGRQMGILRFGKRESFPAIK